MIPCSSSPICIDVSADIDDACKGKNATTKNKRTHAKTNTRQVKTREQLPKKEPQAKMQRQKTNIPMPKATTRQAKTREQLPKKEPQAKMQRQKTNIPMPKATTRQAKTREQ